MSILNLPYHGSGRYSKPSCELDFLTISLATFLDLRITQSKNWLEVNMIGTFFLNRLTFNIVKMLHITRNTSDTAKYGVMSSQCPTFL